MFLGPFPGRSLLTDHVTITIIYGCTDEIFRLRLDMLNNITIYPLFSQSHEHINNNFNPDLNGSMLSYQFVSKQDAVYKHDVLK